MLNNVTLVFLQIDRIRFQTLLTLCFAKGLAIPMSLQYTRTYVWYPYICLCLYVYIYARALSPGRCVEVIFRDAGEINRININRITTRSYTPGHTLERSEIIIVNAICIRLTDRSIQQGKCRGTRDTHLPNITKGPPSSPASRDNNVVFLHHSRL